MGAHTDDLHSLGNVPGDFSGAGADGAGRSQDDNATLSHAENKMELREIMNREEGTIGDGGDIGKGGEGGSGTP